MFDLTGRKALVTGASGGIGEEIARQLHKQGAIVGLHGTRVEKLEALANSLGERVHLFPANLSDRAEVKALGEKAEADLGGVDILVNNAGITKDGLFVRMSDDDWDAGQANYCASKAGMIGMSKSLAQEIATRNVTVNCVAPGFIESAMTEKLNDKQKDAIMGAIPMKRMGTSVEVASAVGYLASNEAGYMTGQTLHVNGGMAMI